MGILNDNLAYLPTVFGSSVAIAGTKKMNVPFNKADLAGMVLNLIPSSWVNQYNMTHSTLPKNPRALLNNLEVIKRVMDEKHSTSLKAKAKEANSASAAAKGSSKKHPASGSSGELRVPKKDHTVPTISDFREPNKKIVRKPYPIPKISTTLQELEGFTYAIPLDLNMGYYTIRLDPAAAKM
jgi:hypothetical protein